MSVVFDRYSGLRATVMGLGRFGGGVAAARFLARQGAVVTVTDLRTAEALADSLQRLADVPIARFELGQHPDDVFQDCDMLVVNPAVPPDQPGIAMARNRGADVTTEIELFCRHNPAAVIAVTGSNGKSTTCALIHHLLQHAWQDETRRAWLGGNIGVSLLDQLTEISAADRVVLELSSFQLELLRPRRFRPSVAVITNFTPNHLDWHGSVEAYRRAKQGILDAQTRLDAAVLPEVGDDGVDWRARGRVFRFGLTDTGEDGSFLENGTLSLRMTLPTQDAASSETTPIDLLAGSRTGTGMCFEESLRLSQPAQLPGQHNGLNLAAAGCAAWLAGASPQRFADALRSFAPLPHRLQLVAERQGVKFFNDSIATTPESAIQALRVFRGRIILLAGGYDKGQDLTPFATEIRHRAAAVVLMGQTAEALQKQITALRESIGNSTPPIVRIGRDFPDSFSQAVALSGPGDIVLLSPGCASYGWFRDYRDRGEQFLKLALDWEPDR